MQGQKIAKTVLTDNKTYKVLVIKALIQIYRDVPVYQNREPKDRLRPR